MQVRRNTAFEYIETREIYRVIEELNPEPSDNEATHYVVIQLDTKIGMPKLIGKKKLLTDFAENRAKTITIPIESVNVEMLTEAEHKTWKKRLALIEIFQEHGAKLYDFRYRGRLSASLAEQKKFSKPFFNGTYRKWLQGGQTPACLVPNFHRCGAPNVSRRAVDGSQKQAVQDSYSQVLGGILLKLICEICAWHGQSRLLIAAPRIFAKPGNSWLLTPMKNT